MSKPRIALTVLSGVLLAGLGVGALAHVARRGAPATPAPTKRIAFVPEAATVVGFVDLRAVAASPLSALIADRQAASEEALPFARLREELGIDPLTDLDAATFSAEAAPVATGDGVPSPGRWGWAVTGSFDGARLEERLASREGVRIEDYEGTTLYLFDRGSGQSLAAALPAKGTLAFGEPDYLRDMLDAGADGTEATTRAVAEWTDTLFAGDTFWIAGEPPRALERLAAGSTEGSGPLGRLPPLSSFALSGRLTEEIALVARVRAADAAGAQNLAELARGLLALGRLNDEVGQELREVLDTARIDQVDDRVALSFEAPFETLRRLLESRRAAADAP